MTAQELKNSILQLAVQGKLVPQDKNDEPASELLKRIDAEKVRLIKEGKIKKEKALPPTTDEEFPFDIPESWEWTSLLQIVYQVGGKENQIHANEVNASGKFPAVSQGKNLVDGYCDCEEKVIYDLPLIMFGDHTRNVKYVDFPFVISADGTKFLKAIVINDKYLFYWTLLSAEMLRNRGYARHFSLLKQLYIPLPPLAEQQRIVDKIEELLPLIEEYGKAETRLKELNADFPDMLRKSILQQAVQGKLTERNPADEPASELLKRIQAEKARLIKEGKIKKEKPLPPITEEEIPFDIPDAWEWVRFKEITNLITCGYAATPEYVEDGMPFLSARNVKPYKFLPENHKRISNDLYYQLTHKNKPEMGDILMTRVGAGIGEACIINTPIDFAIYVSLTLIKLKKIVLPEYVLHWLSSPIGISTALRNIYGKNSSQGNLNVDKVRYFAFPLPPLEEQKRIVARVEELLALCDQLKK